MQKVTGYLPSWDTTKTSSKKGFDKVWRWADKLGAPVNRLSNKVGSEAFWPMTLDKESDKAARILRSFCKDGFYEDVVETTNGNGPNDHGHKQRVLKKIPQEVIRKAVGLAIFTTMRTGLWISGAGGSGVLIARKEDGEWSPPSGILLHTAALGFLVGVDIYDCVLVINNRKALEAFTKMRMTLGGEVSASAGPVGMGGVLEHDGKWKQANMPVFTYMKSRGFYAGVQVDGTVVIERTDENERFYYERIGVADILAGKVRHPPPEIRTLLETVKAAEGSDFDQDIYRSIEDDPAPGDVDLESPRTSMFGVPDVDDPDPYGVLALGLAGMEIREAGTGSRPESQQFEYRPSPTSPVFTHFRRSIDTYGTRSNRASTFSTQTKMSDRGTQTDTNTIHEETKDVGDASLEYTDVHLGPTYEDFSEPSEVARTDSKSTYTSFSEQDGVSDADGSDADEEVVYGDAVGPATVQLLKPQVIQARGNIVNIPKRTPPALPPRTPAVPPRSPARNSVKEEFVEVPVSAEKDGDASSSGVAENDVAGEAEAVDVNHFSESVPVH